jgi:ABC-2 type transport system permease protein/oleandomycin transport system permease protein
MSKLRSAFGDSATIRNRTLRHYRRTPKLLVAAAVQPVIFLLIFEAVFRGQYEALHDTDYIEYLLPGILVQGVLFGSIQTGLALAEDINLGIMDRFRAAPIAPHAVLDGRIGADAVRNTIVFVVVSVTGVLLGFEFHGTLFEVFLAIVLVVLIGVAFSWVQAYLALVTGDAETMQVVGYIWVFPLAFLSSAFVPTSTMPEWLQVFAENQPISFVVDAVRALTKGGYVAHDTIGAFVWIAAILLVFVPLATRRFARLSYATR